MKRLFLLLWILSAGPLWGAVTTGEVATVSSISSTTYMQTGIAIDQYNTVHMTFYNPGDERLKYTRLLNGQTAWSAPINVVDKTVAPQSALALEAQKTPHVGF